MAYEIVNNVPVPKRLRASRYPFGEMSVGTSFFVECTGDEKPVDVATRLRTAAGGYAARNKEAGHLKFVVRCVENGARVWRVQ